MKIKILKIIVLFIAQIFVFNACSSVPRFTSQKMEVKNNTVQTVGNLSVYENNKVLETQIGIASFYADKYHGRITYSGEVYDMNGVSAAHPSYQMGTVLRITNLENGRSVILRVNDKMPVHPDRIIDLSLGAAKELDFVGKGLIKVKIEVLEWGSGRK